MKPTSRPKTSFSEWLERWGNARSHEADARKLIAEAVAASRQDVTALAMRGWLHLEGVTVGMKPSASKARLYLRRAADRGEPNAMLMWADILDSTTKGGDIAEARRLYRVLAKLGDTTAMLNMAVSLLNEGQHREAVKWLKQAADRGDLSARLELAKSQLLGLGQARAPRAALRTLHELGMSDDGRISQFEREQCLMLAATTLLDGWLVPRDYRMACRYLRDAVALGSGAAAGLLRDLGEG